MTSLAAFNYLPAAQQHFAMVSANLCPRTSTTGRNGAAGPASSSGRLPPAKAVMQFAPSRRRLRKRKAGSRSSSDNDDDEYNDFSDYTDTGDGGYGGGSHGSGGSGSGGSGNPGGSSGEGWQGHNHSWNNSTRLLAIFYEIGWVWVMFSAFSLAQALHFMFSGHLRKSEAVCAN